eukprot:scaffold84057_cov17-Tisochrysis_lutea.AAC.3
MVYIACVQKLFVLIQTLPGPPHNMRPRADIVGRPLHMQLMAHVAQKLISLACIFLLRADMFGRLVYMQCDGLPR